MGGCGAKRGEAATAPRPHLRNRAAVSTDDETYNIILTAFGAGCEWGVVIENRDNFFQMLVLENY